jgi:hypothetical protein
LVVTGPSFRKRCAARGGYRQAMGRSSEKSVPTGKSCAFRQCGKALYGNIVCFIKGKRLAGYMELTDIAGRCLVMRSGKNAGGPVMLTARTSCLITEVPG